MKTLIKIVLSILWVIFLTILTQIGGLVWILNRILLRYFFSGNEVQWKSRAATFTGLYLLFTIVLIPLIARPLGRVPLPVSSKGQVQPVTIWTCLLNRHYVRPELKNSVESVAKKLNDRYPGAQLRYLDANFPFIDGFPLLPHLSHNDGRKLDLAFYYLDKKNGAPVNDKPAFTGYGVFEGPFSNEVHTTAQCREKGYWQYDFSKYLTFGSDAEKFVFDPERTRAMMQAFSDEPAIGKMFLEPHLKSRLGLEGNGKIRFHGCQAVRHDDHLHVQLR